MNIIIDSACRYSLLKEIKWAVEVWEMKEGVGGIQAHAINNWSTGSCR